MACRLAGAGRDVQTRSKGYPVILGLVDKCPFGDIVTLSECMLGGSTVGSATNTRENYHASRAYFGAHLKQKEDLAFKSMSLHWRGSRTGHTTTPALWKIAFRPGTPRSRFLS